MKHTLSLVDYQIIYKLLINKALEMDSSEKQAPYVNLALKVAHIKWHLAEEVK